MIAALTLLALIITERNDVTTFRSQLGDRDLGCLPPSAYTFVGDPGIAGKWIPYGNGGTGEITRVSTRLMGVVASALGGDMERSYVGRDLYSAQTCLMRPIILPAVWWSDQGEYLETATNTSLRIADQLNEPIVYYDKTGSEYKYFEGLYTLEEDLIAYAHVFGSRTLDTMTSNAAPPVATTWTQQMPYRLADTNLWRNVWPTYVALTNDLHFYPYRAGYPHNLPKGFGYTGNWHQIWGNDVVEAREDLYDALLWMPLDYTLEDVLSKETRLKYEPAVVTNDYWAASDGKEYTYDEDRGAWIVSETNWWPYVSYDGGRWLYQHDGVSGTYCYADADAQTLEFMVPGTTNVIVMWRTQLRTKTGDDYTHWRNMTRRLDWKRLGIICQLERQMESTYKVYDEHLDYLPYLESSAEHKVDYVCDITLELPLPQTATSVRIPMSEIAPSWDLYGEDYSVTNREDWTYPTCRVPAPTVDAGVIVGGDDLNGFVEIDEETVTDMLTQLVRNIGLTNDTYNLVVVGNWVANGLSFDFTAARVEAWTRTEVQSNTVTFAVDGKEYKVWGTEPIESRDWHKFADGISLSLRKPDPREDRWAVDVLLGDQTYTDIRVYYKDVPIQGMPSGHFDIPETPTFTAIGEGDDYRDWDWIATGIGTTNHTKTVNGREVSWIWDDGSYMIMDYDERYDYYWTWCSSTSTNGNFDSFDYYVTNITRQVKFPTVSIDWETTTRREWGLVYTNDGPAMLEYGIPVVYDVTNAAARAHLGMEKHTRGASTYSTGDAVMRSIIDRFRRPVNEDWDRIFEQSRPTAECMISAVGPRAEMTNDVAFTWEYIRYSQSPMRWFRMSPEDAAARTKAEADVVRWREIRSLDEACKAECVSRGGYDIKQFDTVSRLTQAEQAEIIAKADAGDLVANFAMVTSNDFVIAATVAVSGGYPPSVVVTDAAAGYGATNALPAWVGQYGWEVEPILIAVTNDYETVRADGVQAPVLKTVWKFKNLRDPAMRDAER